MDCQLVSRMSVVLSAMLEQMEQKKDFLEDAGLGQRRLRAVCTAYNLLASELQAPVPKLYMSFTPADLAQIPVWVENLLLIVHDLGLVTSGAGEGCGCRG